MREKREKEGTHTWRRPQRSRTIEVSYQIAQGEDETQGRWHRRDKGDRAPGRQKRKEEVGFILVLKEQAFPMLLRILKVRDQI